MATRILIVRGLGRAAVRPPRKPKGRGPNERELNAIKDDARADELAAKGLARRRIKGACQVQTRQTRKAGRAALERGKAAAAAAVEGAESECEIAREQKRADEKLGRDLGVPPKVRAVVRQGNAEQVHQACAVVVPQTKAQARAALAELRALRRSNNAAAAERCEQTREEVPRLLQGYLDAREARKRLELDERREQLYPARAPRTLKQKQADRERAAKMRGKTRKRAGGARTMVEEADMEGANVPPEWHWLWRRHAFEFVRRARERNAGHPHALVSPSELFADWLHDHGVRDMWEDGPAGSEFGPEFEALQLAEVERERLERELDEAEAAGYSREEARAMMARAVASASAVRKTKPSPATLDDLADLFG